MTLEELNNINDDFNTIDIALDSDGDAYINPHIYGHVDVSPRQGIRVLTMFTAKDIELAIETLQEILQFKIDNPYS